jgi:hypothetical protein
VKESQAWLIGDQIPRGASKCGNDHRILLDPGGGLVVELDKLEQVPVHVQRVRIVTAIVKHQPMAASLPQHEFPFVRILLAVDEPVIDPVGPSRHFLKVGNCLPNKVNVGRAFDWCPRAHLSDGYALPRVIKLAIDYFVRIAETSSPRSWNSIASPSPGVSFSSGS